MGVRGKQNILHTNGVGISGQKHHKKAKWNERLISIENSTAYAMGSAAAPGSQLAEHVQCWSLTNDSFLQKTQQQKALFWYLIKCQQAVLNVSNLQHFCFRILNTIIMWWGLQLIQSTLGVKKDWCWRGCRRMVSVGSWGRSFRALLPVVSQWPVSECQRWLCVC